MTTSRLPLHHCHIMLDLLTTHFLKSHELLIAASFCDYIKKKKTAIKLKDLKIMPSKIHLESFQEI